MSHAECSQNLQCLKQSGIAEHPPTAPRNRPPRNPSLQPEPLAISPPPIQAEDATETKASHTPATGHKITHSQTRYLPKPIHLTTLNHHRSTPHRSGSHLLLESLLPSTKFTTVAIKCPNPLARSARMKNGRKEREDNMLIKQRSLIEYYCSLIQVCIHAQYIYK